MIEPRDFLRYFLYSYVVTSAQLLGNKAPTLRRMVCRNAVKAMLEEHPELKEKDPIELAVSIAESFLGANTEKEEKDGETVVHVRGCRICPRDLIDAFVEEHPNLEEHVYGYNVCAFTTMLQEILEALDEEMELEHEPEGRGHCRVILRKKS
ncbi:MAG: hypothetical protein GXO28_02505 [Methanopyri archaeon]|nr:hypothetical protein [Methanopyri archaeon]